MAVERRAFGLSLVLLFVLRVTTSSDVDKLLAFKAIIFDPSGSLRTWTNGSGSGPCTDPTWFGVSCNRNGVFRIQLEGTGLSGRLELEALAGLTALRTISFSNNSFDGPMPDLRKIKGLKSAYLSMNKFNGNIPEDSFQGMLSLRKIDLSRNVFTGPIPSSLADASTLLEVRMGDNEFEGKIPDFASATELSVFDVSNNDLEGRIPERFSKMDANMFAGNKNLCGPPLAARCKLTTPAPPPTSTRSSTKHGLSSSITIAIVVIGVGVTLAVVAAAFAVVRTRKRDDVADGRKNAAAVRDEKEGLVFVRDDGGGERFGLQELLRASAEALGRGGELGSSYKAAMADGRWVVVKRFKEMNGVAKEEFREHMGRMGRLSHPNLLPVVAYYYKKEEKLLVADYVPHGSLAALLHGNRGPNTPNLDWLARLRVVKGIARGLAYLHKELSPVTTAPHGHLKSSNVLLDENLEPLLTDYALVPVMNPSHASRTMVAYRSPEYRQFGRLSKKSDVWSLGVLILEILTGKFPGNYSRQGHGGPDLASWVNSVVREEWTGEVFDGEMRRSRNGEGDMLRLLQIGLLCCEADANKRLELKRVLEQIEELKEREVDDDGYSFLSEGEGYYSKAISEEDFSFSMNK